MAVKKKETKAAEVKDTEVIENGLQNSKEIIGEEVTEEVNSKEEVNKEVTLNAEDTITVDTSVAEESAPKEEKMVKIKPNCDYRFYYGTKWYVLCKGVIMNVPQEVKERLQEAGKLSAI